MNPHADTIVMTHFGEIQKKVRKVSRKLFSNHVGEIWQLAERQINSEKRRNHGELLWYTVSFGAKKSNEANFINGKKLYLSACSIHISIFSAFLQIFL